MATSTTNRLSKTLLDHETDARFWAQTGYKPTKKLDPKDPTDKAMMKVWLDIFAKVKKENDAGKLVLTYNHPAVDAHLADAAVAQDAAAQHVENGANAAAAGDMQTASAAAVAAADAQQAAETSRATAAAMQPPTVSPQVADDAAADAAQSAGQASPPKVDLHPKHPGNAPHAQPARPRQIFNAGMSAPPDDENTILLRKKIRALVAQNFGGSFRALFDRYATAASNGGEPLADRAALVQLLSDAGVGNALTRGFWTDGVMERVDADKDGHISWQEFQSVVGREADDHMALEAAKRAAHTAANVHEVAAQVAQATGSTVQTTTPPQTIDHIRGLGRDMHDTDPHPFVGVVLSLDPGDGSGGTWAIQGFDTRDALDSWYGTLTDQPTSFQYAAAYDKAASDVDPAAEVFGSGQAIPVSVSVDTAPPTPPGEPQVQIVERKSYGPAFALAAGGATAVIAVLANRRH